MKTETTSANIHGSAIVLGYHGLLVLGPSGSGKTTLCHRLIDTWQSAGQFATWVGDDQIFCESFNSKHVVNAAPTIVGLAERHFSGISKVNHQTSAVLDLEICLVPNSKLDRLPELRTSAHSNSLTSIDVPERNAELAIELIIDRLKSI